MDANEEGLLDLSKNDPNSLLRKLKKYSSFYDKKETFLLGKEGRFVSGLFEKTRVEYEIVQFKKLIDSSNMNMTKIREILKIIVDRNSEFDGFVIIHGTNTLEYTASALSFMLTHLNKTVIVTGSQVPLSSENNDAYPNLYGCFRILAKFFIPEVCVYFNQKLMRGNRTQKTESARFDGFRSTIPPLIISDVHFEIDWENLLPRKLHRSLEILPKLSDEWVYIKLHPLSSHTYLDGFFSQKSIRCFILDSKAGFEAALPGGYLFDSLSGLVKEGKVIYMLTNFEESQNQKMDQVHKDLLSVGVVMDNYITFSAAMAKVSVLLGNYSDPKTICEHLGRNLKGETDLKQHKHTLTHFQKNPLKRFIKNLENLKNTDLVFASGTLETAYFVEALRSGHMKVIESVLKVVNQNSKDHLGRPAIHIIVKEKNAQYLKSLGEIGVRFDLKNKQHVSCMFECLERMELDKCSVISRFGGRAEAPLVKIISLFQKAIFMEDNLLFKLIILFIQWIYRFKDVI